MSDQDQTKEIKRLRHLLLKMAELAEHVEQTGSFESGVLNSVKRYNAIVRRVEEIEAVPANMFPLLEESANSGQLGAEATLLAEYLEDMAGEDSSASSHQPPELHSLVALAPFLGSKELSQLVRARFPQLQTDEENEPVLAGESSAPDLKTLVELAPHLRSEDLGELVRACLARKQPFNPKYLTRLAPHLNSRDLGLVMRNYMPEWFGVQPAPPAPPAPPASPAHPVEEMSHPGSE